MESVNCAQTYNEVRTKELYQLQLTLHTSQLPEQTREALVLGRQLNAKKHSTKP